MSDQWTTTKVKYPLERGGIKKNKGAIEFGNEREWELYEREWPDSSTHIRAKKDIKLQPGKMMWEVVYSEKNHHEWWWDQEWRTFPSEMIEVKSIYKPFSFVSEFHHQMGTALAIDHLNDKINNEHAIYYSKFSKGEWPWRHKLTETRQVYLLIVEGKEVKGKYNKKYIFGTEDEKTRNELLRTYYKISDVRQPLTLQMRSPDDIYPPDKISDESHERFIKLPALLQEAFRMGDIYYIYDFLRKDENRSIKELVYKIKLPVPKLMLNGTEMQEVKGVMMDVETMIKIMEEADRLDAAAEEEEEEEEEEESAAAAARATTGGTFKKKKRKSGKSRKSRKRKSVKKKKFRKRKNTKKRR